MGSFLITSLVSHRTRRPMVQIQMGSERAQIEATEALQLAMNILEAAEAAQTDAFIFEFATKRLALDDNAAATLIGDFRKYREAMAKPPQPPPTFEGPTTPDDPRGEYRAHPPNPPT